MSGDESDKTSDSKGKPTVTFEVGLASIGIVTATALWWLYGQIRDLDRSVNAVLTEQKGIAAQISALQESNRDLKGELDRLAPRSWAVPPVVEPTFPSPGTRVQPAPSALPRAATDRPAGSAP